MSANLVPTTSNPRFFALDGIMRFHISLISDHFIYQAEVLEHFFLLLPLLVHLAGKDVSAQIYFPTTSNPRFFPLDGIMRSINH